MLSAGQEELRNGECEVLRGCGGTVWSLFIVTKICPWSSARSGLNLLPRRLHFFNGDLISFGDMSWWECPLLKQTKPHLSCGSQRAASGQKTFLQQTITVVFTLC